MGTILAWHAKMKDKNEHFQVAAQLLPPKKGTLEMMLFPSTRGGVQATE